MARRGVGVYTHPHPDLKAPYFRDTLGAIRRFFLARRIPIKLNPPALSTDGALFLAPPTDDVRFSKCRKAGLPLVLLHAVHGRCHSVDMDNVESARRAVRYLISLGHERIAVLNGKMEMKNARDRYAGYRKELENHRFRRHSRWEGEGRFDRRKGYGEMRRILCSSPRPTAVFAANDHMALGAMEAIRRAGLDVPGDVSVVGFDDVPEARRADPALTTIRQPLEEMAVSASGLLLRLMEGRSLRKTPSRVVFRGRLIIRRSCRTI